MAASLKFLFFPVLHIGGTAVVVVHLGSSAAAAAAAVVAMLILRPKSIVNVCVCVHLATDDDKLTGEKEKERLEPVSA